jgi:small-conductance mechanosensitive channel
MSTGERAFRVGDHVEYSEVRGRKRTVRRFHAVIELLRMDGTAGVRVWRSRHRTVKRLADLTPREP